MLQAVYGIDLSSDIELASSAVQIFNGRMLCISSKNFFCLLGPINSLEAFCVLARTDLLVWLINVVNCNDGEILVVAEVAKRDPCSGF